AVHGRALSQQDRCLRAVLSDAMAGALWGRPAGHAGGRPGCARCAELATDLQGPAQERLLVRTAVLLAHQDGWLRALPRPDETAEARMETRIAVIPHGRRELWCTLGQFFCDRDVIREMAGPLYSGDGVTWFVARDGRRVVGFCSRSEEHTSELQ